MKGKLEIRGLLLKNKKNKQTNKKNKFGAQVLYSRTSNERPAASFKRTAITVPK